MKILAVNGSPRKKHNTSKLLSKVLEGAADKGAETELIHLGELQYTGCISCFQCKVISGPSYGRCAVKDGLTPVLDKAHEADALVMGTPLYFMTDTAFMRAFLERLWFQYYLYSQTKPPVSPRKKGTALIYTMNVREEDLDKLGVNDFITWNRMVMERLFSPCEVLMVCDTLQFDDYSKYDNDYFDVDAKKKRNREMFPKDLERAKELGGKLVSDEILA